MYSFLWVPLSLTEVFSHFVNLTPDFISTTPTSVHVGKEIGEVSKETEVDYKNDSEDVKGVKIHDNRIDKNGNKVAVDKVKPPAPKLDEEAARKSKKQKKKCSSEVDTDRLDEEAAQQ